MGHNVRSIAQAAGVSVATVSRVLNNSPSVSEKLRERVLAVIEQKNYLPNAGARSLSTRRQEVIGVIFPQEMYSEFFPELIKGLEKAARHHGSNILLAGTDGKQKTAQKIARSLFGKVDGLIFATPEIEDNVLDRVTSRVPNVWVNHVKEDGSGTAVVTDNICATRVMIDHLYEQGARKIVFINGPQDHYEARERQRGVIDALKHHGLEPAMLLPGDFTEQGGYLAGQELLRSGREFDAIFAANDVTAIGCMSAMNQVGLFAPKDFLLAGFDCIPLSGYVTPRLTSMRVNVRQMGERAIHLLMEKIAGNLDDDFCESRHPELVVRESTQKPTPYVK